MTCCITLAIYSDVMILLQANINVLKKLTIHRCIVSPSCSVNGCRVAILLVVSVYRGLQPLVQSTYNKQPPSKLSCRYRSAVVLLPVAGLERL